MRNPKVFVSHSNKDNVFTRKLISDLRSHGMEVWVDFEKISSGDFARSINEGLAKCEWLILVLTPNALASEWVINEVNAAVTLHSKGLLGGVVPVIAEDCSRQEMPPIWDVYHNYNAVADYDAAIEGLSRAILTAEPIQKQKPTISIGKKRRVPVGTAITVAGAVCLVGIIGITRMLHRPTYYAGTWSKVHGDLASTGRSIAPSAKGVQSWELKVSGKVLAAVVIGPDERIYGTTFEGALFALSKSGEWKWEVQTGASASAPVVASDNTVIIHNEEGKILAFDGSEGQKKWQYNGDKYSWISSPMITNHGLVICGDGGNVVALDARTGERRWVAHTGGIVTSTPALGANDMIYVGSHDSKFYAIDAPSGAIRWSINLPSPIFPGASIGEDGTVFIGCDDNHFYALNGKTGGVKWSFQTEGAVCSTASIGQDGTVYFGCNDKNVYAVAGQTGIQKWKFRANDLCIASPVLLDDGTLYAASRDGHLYALNSLNGSVKWRFPLGVQGYGPIDSSPAIGNDGTVYFGSPNGFVEAIK